MNTTKKFLAIAQTIVLLSIPTVMAAETKAKDKWAVVVGVSKHLDPSIVPLKYGAKNATDFANFLIESEHFSKDHVRVLLDEKATRSEVLKALGSRFLPLNAHPDDLVVVYFSSAASPAEMDNNGVRFLLPYDADSKTVYSTGIALQDFPRTLSTRINTDQIVVFFEAPYSGGGYSRTLGRRIGSNNGILTIAACGPAEKALESNKLQNGIFTHYLIDDLKKSGTDSSLRDALKTLPDEVTVVAKKEGAAEQHVYGLSDSTSFDPMLGALPIQPRNPSALEK